MCQVADTCAANPFHEDASASKRRTRTAAAASCSLPGSNSRADAEHYNLRTKRVRTYTSSSPQTQVRGKRARTAAPTTTTTMGTTAVTVTVGRNLNAEVKSMQQQVHEMQARVNGAVAGISELKRLVLLLAQQRHLLSHLDFKQPHLSDVNDIAEQADSFADLSIYMRSLLLPLPLRLLCLVALSIALALLHGAHGANGSEYRIGIGKSDITGPVAEIVLMGYGDPDQKGTGILNRLYETYNSCEWVPEILPVQVVKIGQFGLAVTNFEVSTMAGRRIRATVLEALANSGVTEVEVAAMSNAYAQYVTTKEEYATQHYEGASTLFGPNQLEALQQELARVAASIADPQLPIDVGPLPQQFDRSTLYSLQPPVVLDTPGWGKRFGDLRSDAHAAYAIGSNVTVTFYGGHPRNQFSKAHSFCDVERETTSGAFETLLTDSHWDLRFLWERKGLTESKSTCLWLLRSRPATNTLASGRYRIRHRGFYKSITGTITPYAGVSSVFYVRVDAHESHGQTAEVCLTDAC